MSTVETTELPRATPHALADPAGRVTAAAGALLVGALGLVLGGAGTTLALTLLGAGVVLAAIVLVPRAVAAAQRHPVLLAGVALVVLGLAVIAVLGVYGFLSGRSVLWPLVRLRRLIAVVVPLSIVAVAALGGVVLIADDLRARFELAQRGLTPWQRLAGTAEVPAPAPWRALGGLALIGLAAVLGLGLIGYHDGHRLVTLALVLVPVAGAMVLIAVPLVIASLARSDRASVTAAREEERLRVAAHLHDSVLQTLALVQRQAHDPVAVARLARRQEHELRAWMAGEVELGSETLGAALREAVAEVEDEHQTVVELTILGDRSLDRGTEALAGAAREALRNAARHAPGAPIFVFAQASPDGAEVFVRDEGPGFELAGVPTERRGVRDSIVGRMTAVGGSAAVESHPGEGTEIALRIGVLT